MIGITDAALAIVLGGGLGAGICLLLVLLPRWGAPSLERRIAPYIRDVADPQGLTPLAPVPSPTALWQGLQDRLASVLGGTDAVARRLRQSGRRADGATARPATEAPGDPDISRAPAALRASAGLGSGAASSSSGTVASAPSGAKHSVAFSVVSSSSITCCMEEGRSSALFASMRMTILPNSGGICRVDSSSGTGCVCARLRSKLG